MDSERIRDDTVHSFPGRLHRLGLRWLPLLFLVWIALPARALDPHRPLDACVRTDWTIREGLPQNSVNAIVQDREGYLWLATYGGLARFDGKEFVVFHAAFTEGLTSDRVLDLLNDSEGRMWIGTETRGLCCREGDRFLEYRDDKGMSIDFVRVLHEDRRHRLWVGTEAGLAMIESGRCRRWGVEQGLPHPVVLAIAQGAGETVWIGSEGGLCRWTGEALEGVDHALLSTEPITSLLADSDGTIWVGSGAGLHVFRDGLFQEYPLSETGPCSWVSSLFEDGDGNLWFGTLERGFGGIRDGEIQFLPAGDGLRGEGIACLMEDREGSLWIGTTERGLHRLRNGAVLAYGGEGSPLGLPTRTVLPDGVGGILVGTYGGGLFQVSAAGRVRPVAREVLRDRYIQSLYRDSRGRVWVGGIDLLCRLRGDSVESAGAPFDEGKLDIGEITEHRGILHVGTFSGLIREAREGSWEWVEGTRGLLIRALLSDGDSLWMGTEQGVILLVAGELRRWDRDSGLSHDNVRTLHLDADGVLWAGTYGGGLNRISTGRIVQYTAFDGLPDNVVSFIAEDSEGRLWMTGNRGVFGVKRNVLNAFAAGETSSVNGILITESQGMITRECNGGSQPAGMLTEDGRLHVPTIDGIAVIDTRSPDASAEPPEVRVVDVLVNGRSAAAGKPVNVPPGPNRMEVHFIACTLTDHQNIRYRYRLSGFDRGWVEAGARNLAIFTNVPAGDYTFQISASNGGRWGEGDSGLTLRVRAPYWEAWWFLCLCGLLVLALFYLLLRVRTRGLVHDTLALQKAVEDRTEELRTEKSALERRVLERTADLKSVNDELEAELRERRRIQGELAQSEGRFRTLFDNSPLGIFWVTPNDKFVLANPALVEMLGYASFSELKGRKLCTDVSLDGMSQEECFAGGTREESVLVRETVWHRKGGAPLHVRVHTKLFSDDRGGGIRYQGVVEDITPSREARERIRLMETVIETMDLGLTVSDMEGKIVYTNLAEARMHGYEPRDLLGQTSRMLAPETLWKRTKIDQMKEGKVMSRDSVNLRKDGSTFPVHLTSVPVTDERGQATALITICEDLSEKAEAVMARDAAEKELAEQKILRMHSDRLRSLGEMSTGIAHELNQPLLGVRGLAEHLLIAMERDWDLPAEKTREKLMGIVAQADRMTHIIEHVRMFAREAGRPGRSAVNIEEVVQSACGLLQAQFRSRGVNLVVEQGEGLPPVGANPYSLEEVIINLLINARDAVEEAARTGRHDRPASVVIRTGRRDGEVIIQVVDKGMGIPEEVMGKIYDPFFTTKGPETGTGLGMPISKAIVELYGGRIELETEVGAGTTVTVIIPEWTGKPEGNHG